MPRRPVSRDLKARIPILFHEQNLKVKEICTVLGIRKTLVYDTLKLHRTFGLAYNPHAKHVGRERSLTTIDMKYIYNLLQQRHLVYLDEIQKDLSTQRHVHVSIATMLRTLHRLHFTRKCVSARALERNDLQRSAFMNRIGAQVPDPAMLMFVDEAARNNTVRRIRIEIHDAFPEFQVS